jgi:hypothetical protein
VVDPEDLALVERLVQACVELAGARQVGAERLLHDDARALDESGAGEHGDHLERRRRRHAEVVQAANVVASAQLDLGLLDGVGQGVRPGGGRHEAQT